MCAVGDAVLGRYETGSLMRAYRDIFTTSLKQHRREAHKRYAVNTAGASVKLILRRPKPAATKDANFKNAMRIYVRHSTKLY